MSAPAAGADDTNVRARDNGRTVTIAPGDRLIIRLGSCEASCGYRWQTTRRPNARILRRVSSRLNGQVRTFTYAGRRLGTTSLRLSYDPPGTPKAKRHFRLKVRVTPRVNPPSSQPGPLPPVLVAARDNGEAVRVAPGQRLAIALRSCEGSCGYRWRTVLAPKRGVLRRTGSTYDGQTRTFNYVGVQPGLTHVRLAYVPPGRQKVRRFFRLTVMVARPRCAGPDGAAAAGAASSLRFGSVGAGRDTESLVLGCVGSVGRTFELFRTSSDRGFNIHGVDHPAVNGRFGGFAETFQDTRTGERPTNTIRVYDLETGELFWNAPVASEAATDPYDQVTALELSHLGDAAWVVRRRTRSELWVRAAGAVRLADAGAIDPASLKVYGYRAYYRKGATGLSVQMPRNARTRVVGLDQSGRTIAVRKGDDVVVRLNSCEGSCGYSWRFARNPDPNVLLGVSEDYTRDSLGERRDFAFTALGRGTTRLRLEYMPPGRGRKAERTFALKVVVR